MAAFSQKFFQQNKINLEKLFICQIFRSFGKYVLVEPGTFSSVPNSVPSHIAHPTFEPVSEPQIRTPNDIVRIKECCQTARKVLDFASQLVKVGESTLGNKHVYLDVSGTTGTSKVVCTLSMRWTHAFLKVCLGITTEALDLLVHERIVQLGVYPSPLLYRGFPKSICTSVNNVVCHGIPDDRPLLDGDIVNIDVTVFQNGFHGDCSRTVLVGDVDDVGQSLVGAAEACLAAGIKACRDGVLFRTIGDVIEEVAVERGVTIVPAVAGHGVGRQFHEPPDIYHFGDSPYEGIMKKGMTFTIEPAVTNGGPEIEVLDDGWTAVTLDGARSAQVEHTVLITEEGCQVLTMGRPW